MSTKATICPTCNGRGTKQENTFMVCTYCHGTGLNNRSDMLPPLRGNPCIYCNGTGKRTDICNRPCNSCYGTGYK